MEEQYTEIKLPRLISDGMVLQRNEVIKIWGWAPAGEQLTITFRKEVYQTIVDTRGNWEIILMDLSSGGPYEMTITCAKQIKIISDVLIGDVWVLGGQSNMQLQVGRTLDLFEEEIRDAENSHIRKFGVPEAYNFHAPVDELSDGAWKSVTPSSIYEFSAAGYFFAKKLYDKYKVPIGLLHTAIGGTPAEAWMSEKSLMSFGRFQELLSLCKDDEYVNGTKLQDEMSNNEWYSELNKKDKGLQDTQAAWYSENYNDSSWNEMELPCSFRGGELENVKGSIWFRKEITLTQDWTIGKAKLILGTIIDGDDTYINGVQVGNTGYLYPPRRYEIPEGILKVGKNILAVRVIITQNIGGFVMDMPYYLKVGGEKLPISGRWNYQIGAIMPPQKPTTFFQYKPTGVYNGMIYPLRNYSIKGVIWYQGESNDGHPSDYKDLFETVIKDWRATWSLGNFPFLYVQLANYCPWRREPEISSWARIREEQRRVMETENTGMAVTIDIGEYNDLHPQDKKSVGERLALWAMNKVYKEEIVCSGPMYDHMEIEGDRIRLYFTYIGGGLTFKGNDLKSFQITSGDGVYAAAKAQVDGDTVVVTQEDVKNPISVRYAWADNPEEANLYNKEGLPASPFATLL
jgi:sialate O-acetylesterase